MTEPTTDTRPTDTIRDAFDAMLWFLACLIGPLRPRKITPAEEVGALAACEVETDFEPDEPPAPLLALRGLVTRAAEEHNRRTTTGGDFTPERIREARERCERATPGPLNVYSEGFGSDGDDSTYEESLYREGNKAVVMVLRHDGSPAACALADLMRHAREDLPAALDEIERLAGKTATLSTELAEARTFALERADQADSALRRLHHAHDSANRLYGAARGILDDWQGSPEEPADVANLRRAIDPAEEASALTEVQRRDGLEREIERLTAELAARAPADASRPGLTLEQSRTWVERRFPSLVGHAKQCCIEIAVRASRGETGPAAEPFENIEQLPPTLGPGIGGAPIRVRPTAAPDPLALDPEDGTLCADCKTPRNTIHGALCSLRWGKDPGRVPDPRATLHAGDPASVLPDAAPVPPKHGGSDL